MAYCVSTGNTTATATNDNFKNAAASSRNATIIGTGRLSRVKKFQLCLGVAAFFVFVYMGPESAFLSSSEIPQGGSVEYKNATVTATSTATAMPGGGNSQVHTTPFTPRPTTAFPTKALSPPPTRFPTRVPTTTGGMIDNHLHNQPMITFPPQSRLVPSAFTLHQSPFATTDFSNLPDTTQSFVDGHCDLAPLKDWYPPNNGSTTWQLRAPYVIVSGVWSCGVATLGHALQKHPQVLPRSHSAVVQDFFLPRQFSKFRSRDKVKVFAARERLYAQVFPKARSILSKEEERPSDPAEVAAASQDQHQPSSTGNHQIAVDVSPGYLFYAAQTSVAIQCVIPWAKVVLVLRNPVDRIYQQWVYGRQTLGLRLSLDDYMAQDIKAMQSVGLIPSTSSVNNNNNDSDNYGVSGRRTLVVDEGGESASATVLERDAWKQYQSIRNLAGAIGRSLYILQLEEWFDTLQRAGKDPKTEVRLIRSEVWEAQPYQEYQQLIDFLGLSPYTPQSLSIIKKASNAQAISSTSSLGPMEDETRQMLEDFFAPYNQRLVVLLQEHGFNEDGDWSAPLWN